MVRPTIGYAKSILGSRRRLRFVREVMPARASSAPALMCPIEGACCARGRNFEKARAGSEALIRSVAQLGAVSLRASWVSIAGRDRVSAVIKLVRAAWLAAKMASIQHRLEVVSRRA